jgi:plastocyanin domain-containing protein
MEALVINLIGIALIALIVWWFWISKPKALRVENRIVDIVVDGGVYTPARIEVPAGEKITLRFLRKDPSPCAEQVIFESFGTSEELTIGKVKEIELLPAEPGEYSFTCQMQMYRGTLVAT